LYCADDVMPTIETGQNCDVIGSLIDAVMFVENEAFYIFALCMK